MCWCFRVYWTVLHNLFVRFFTNVVDFIQNKLICCCFNKLQHKQFIDNSPEHKTTATNTTTPTSTRVIQHDYVIVDEIEAEYLEIEPRKIETEAYYRLIDRAAAEYVLADSENGACLVRPYKEADITIKYIISIYANGEYFHLFIRRIQDKDRYCIGQLKPHERSFSSPNDIIEFYSHNVLQCTNKNATHRVLLKPLNKNKF